MALDWINMADVRQSSIENDLYDWLAAFLVQDSQSATLYFPVLSPPERYLVLWRKGRDPDSPNQIDSALVLPPTVNLVFDPGAVLQLRQVEPNGEPPVPLRAADVLLTIEGHVDAGPRQIFDVFDASGLVVGAGVAVHGQMVGPGSNRVLYPQWWGAQSDPNNLAWNLPKRDVNPPLAMKGDHFGHVECVDSIATQLCFAASRPGQTVRFAGDFCLSRINLGKKNQKEINVRAWGDGLLLEGYGGTLEAPSVRPFPARPTPLGDVTIPGTTVQLAGPAQLVLLTNRLQAAFDGHLRDEGKVRFDEDAVAGSFRFHFGGNTDAFDDTYGTDTNFANAHTGNQLYISTFDPTGVSAAAAALSRWVGQFNAHLNVEVEVEQGSQLQTRMSHPRQDATALPDLPPPPTALPTTGPIDPAALNAWLAYAYDVLERFVAHVRDGFIHLAYVGPETWLPNPDRASAMMRRVGKNESMFAMEPWTGESDARVRLEGLHLVGPLRQILELNQLLPTNGQLEFKSLTYEQAHGFAVGAQQPGIGGSGGGRLAVEVDDCVFEYFLGDAIRVGGNIDFVGKNLTLRECVRASVSSVSGSSTVHLRNFTVTNDPELGLGSTLDVEQDSNGVDLDNALTSAVHFEAVNGALLGGAHVDVTAWSGFASYDRPSLVRMRNIVCDRGGITAEITGGGALSAGLVGLVDVEARNCHFGSTVNTGDTHTVQHGRLRMIGCTFEPYGLSETAIQRFNARAPCPIDGDLPASDRDPSSKNRCTTPWGAFRVSMKANAGASPLVELVGCAFLLSEAARLEPGWWAAVQFSGGGQGVLSLRGCTISDRYDFGVQNLIYRRYDQVTGKFLADGAFGGHLVARQLVNLATLPFDLLNNQGPKTLLVDLDGIETRALEADDPGALLRIWTQPADRLSVRGWWTAPESRAFNADHDFLRIRKSIGKSWDHRGMTLGGRHLNGTRPITEDWSPAGLAGDIYRWIPRELRDEPFVVAWRCVGTGGDLGGEGTHAVWAELRTLVPEPRV